MMTARSSLFPRGSEWRRWDLHIHTPHSALHHQFGNDFDAYALALFTKAAAAGIAVIGITDYFTIEGYKALRTLVENEHRLTTVLGAELAAVARQIVLLPNVEFRARDVIIKKDSQARINFHVMFSDELTPAEIEERFLHRLQFAYEGLPGGADQEMALTVANLTRFGELLQEQHENFLDRSALQVGMTQVVIDYEAVTKLLTSQQRLFKDRALFAVPIDEDLAEINWDGQAHMVRKKLLQKSEIVFSASSGTRDFCLGLKAPSVKQFVSEFKSRKPCIHGSDAHEVEKLFEPDGQKYLWVKADPTFNGLRQLLHEPEDRVFIGERPPALTHVDAHATKYLKEVKFSRTSQAHSSEKWFTGAIPLNACLVAVIGKKGSGKSALADILGLVGNARTQSDFSFLNPKRFLRVKNGLGPLFCAEIVWRSGDSAEKQLNAKTDASLPESVEYIPQNHLERICSDIEESPSTAGFNTELESVIFSHVDVADRLGLTSLRALIDYRTEEKDAALTQLTNKLADVNRSIVDLQRQQTREYRARLEGELAQRQSELEAHEAAKPPPEVEPSKDPDRLAQSNIVREDLAQVVTRIEGLDQALATNRQQRESTARQIAAIDRVLARVANLRSTVESFYADSSADEALVGIDIRTVVSLTSDTTALEESRVDATSRAHVLQAAVDPEDEASVVAQRAKASTRADELRARLDEPTRRYEEYQRRLATWNKARTAILGSAEEPETRAGLIAQLSALDEVPALEADERKLQEGLTAEIFSVKAALLADYQALYAPVQEFISTHEVAAKMDDALSFSAAIAVDGLVDRLLGMIHKGRKGAFQGDSRELLESLVAQHDFSSAAGVATFTAEIFRLLTTRPDDDVPALTAIESQLAQSVSAANVYDFLFGLSYLQPQFGLLWRGKPLEQLSPGERGTLLLVFYLLIDRRDVPLIIDQPEENLDNETIMELLVPAIKYAKARRQVIIVTHNPNLAVVCDADQIIHSSIAKDAGNEISYVGGSIEDPTITRLIVDVLEGTKPAFDLRDAKYDVLERAI
jgi:energy-coupling factor transporter ATP-binding protein EcfA2